MIKLVIIGHVWEVFEKFVLLVNMLLILILIRIIITTLAIIFLRLILLVPDTLYKSSFPLCQLIWKLTT